MIPCCLPVCGAELCAGVLSCLGVVCDSALCASKCYLTAPPVLPLSHPPLPFPIQLTTVDYQGRQRDRSLPGKVKVWAQACRSIPVLYILCKNITYITTQRAKESSRHYSDVLCLPLSGARVVGGWRGGGGGGVGVLLGWQHTHLQPILHAARGPTQARKRSAKD